MKKILVALLSLTMLFLMVSCGEDNDAPSGMKYACDKEIVDYSFFVPDTWTVDETKGHSMAHVSSTDKSSVSVMQWNVGGEVKNLETWWEDYKTQISTQLGEMREISEEEKTTVSGISATKRSYKMTIGGNEYKYLVCATVNRGSVYIITYTSVEENGLYDSHIEDVNKIIENFKFN